MSWLSDSLTGLQNTVKATQRDINQSGALGDFFTNTGGSITDAYKAAPGSMELKHTFFDPSRDSAYNSLRRQTVGTGMMLEGKNPFLQEAGDVEYNQNMAKRAAIVAAAYLGGAALAGGGAGGGGAATTTATTTPAATAPVAPAATTAAAPTAATTGGTVAPTTSYGVGAGNIGNSSVLAGSPYAGYVSAAPVAAGAGGGGTAASGASSWAPYAQAGGSILSTLFSGLLQMEKEREARTQEIKMTQAKAAVERAQAQNSALDRLIQVWRR